MAVRKTGMRRIVVDGIDYVWKFPRRPSHFDWDCWGDLFREIRVVPSGVDV